MNAPQTKPLAEKWTPPPHTELCTGSVSTEYPAPLTRLESGSRAEPGLGDTGDPRATEDIAFDEALFTPFQRLVHTRLEEAACLLSTMIAEEGQLEKAGIVMASLGRKLAGTLMKQLAEDELHKGIQAIASLEHISAEARRDVVDEFQRRLKAGDFSIKGGLAFARGALEYAVGPHQAREILEQGQVARTASSSAYEVLKNVAPDQIAPFISQEHPQTIALILSQLDPPQAAGILTQLPERMQADVAYRIATMENIPPVALRQIGESLEASLRDILGGNQDVGGPKVVADIINLTGSSVEKNVLDQMDAQDSAVAELVRNLMFVFADIVKLSDREIQTLLREVDQKDLVVALKAADDELKAKILNNMSERVRSFIAQEMEFLGPMRLSEVEEVQLRIVQQVRQLEEQGQITVVRGDSEDTFV